MPWNPATASSWSKNTGNSLAPGDIGFDYVPTGNVDPSIVIPGNVDISDAKTYGDLYGLSSEEQIQWMIEHDPENAQGWIEKLIGLRGNRENVQIARDNEEYIAKNQAKWIQEGLQAAGINPILAYQYMSSAGGNVGTPGYPSGSVFSDAVSRENAKISAKNKEDTTRESKAMAGVFAILVALIYALA